MTTVPGTLYILTAPSGAGKTTLANALVATMDNMQLSVSYTTRERRLGEEQGVHYWFVEQTEFERMLKEDAFLEHAHVHGNYYGTSRQQVEGSIAAGNDVILAIDWQGAQQMRQHFANLITVFILPPSRAQLQTRLESRGQDSAATIEQRLDAAAGEIAHCDEFDYWVVNDDLAHAISDLQAIIRAHRLIRQKQQLRQAKLLAEWDVKR